MKFLHIGMVVGERRPDMVYVDALKVWITDAAKSPYAVEQLWFEPDSPMAGAIQRGPHVAFAVDSVDEAVAGKAVLLPKTDIGPAYIAFVWDGGIVVEFYQFKA